MNQRNLLDVDWTKIPAPPNDGAAAHLKGMTIPPLRPGRDRRYLGDAVGVCRGAPWCSLIPPHRRTQQDRAGRRLGHDPRRARGCTPADLRVFRDLFFRSEGRRPPGTCFGLSTQSNAYQTEMGVAAAFCRFPGAVGRKAGA